MIRAVIWKLRRLFQRGADTDFDAQIATHSALLAKRYASQGMSPEEAARAASRQFGNTTLLKEDRRAMQTFPTLEELWWDVRYAARVLKKNPSFTATVVLTLALSIGANTGIFSVVNGLLLRPLSFQQPERVMMLEDRWLPGFQASKPDRNTSRHGGIRVVDSSSWRPSLPWHSTSLPMAGRNAFQALASAQNLPSLLG